MAPLTRTWVPPPRRSSKPHVPARADSVVSITAASGTVFVYQITEFGFRLVRLDGRISVIGMLRASSVDMIWRDGRDSNRGPRPRIFIECFFPKCCLRAVIERIQRQTPVPGLCIHSPTVRHESSPSCPWRNPVVVGLADASFSKPSPCCLLSRKPISTPSGWAGGSWRCPP